MAKNRGMTLDEAASGGIDDRHSRGSADFHRERSQASGERRHSGKRSRGPATATERVFANALHLMDFHLQQAKAQREAALKAAYDRGLDKGDKPTAQLASPGGRSKRNQGRRLPPEVHARILLNETQFSIKEVARITGLDVYKVTSLKLQMRKAA
ncbi:hypothetical protein [Kiloniella sp. b19]|uniref:hypothetical protein n=1 Tax=Kiloniella sp. GXU_MW_B19 TaxID=3141326 RepID=UPI0031D4DE52